MPRPILEQPFISYALPVGLVPTQLNPNMELTALVDSFLVCVPSTAANNVFYGDGNVTIATGLEIVAGTTISFVLEQVRQMYEIQFPLLDAMQALTCKPTVIPEDIPFIVWNPSNFYLIAAAATTVRIMLFKVPYY